MNNQVYILSRCLGEVGKYQGYEFHFRGFYKGKKIKRIVVNSKNWIEVNEEYLIHLSEVYVRDEVLYGQVLRIKRLFNMN